jgi:glutathione S-transferase
VGDRLSIADIHLFRLFWRFHAAADLRRSEFPKLFAHHDRMLARPAVQQVIEIEAALA